MVQTVCELRSHLNSPHLGDAGDPVACTTSPSLTPPGYPSAGSSIEIFATAFKLSTSGIHIHAYTRTHTGKPARGSIRLSAGRSESHWRASVSSAEIELRRVAGKMRRARGGIDSGETPRRYLHFEPARLIRANACLIAVDVRATAASNFESCL